MGGVVSAGEDNDDLIDNLVAAEYIKSPMVERAFRSVDRGDYYTEEGKNTAYKDMAWKEGNLHMSAPCIYSEAMEYLDLRPGLSFLNLGSGTGYLSTMVGLILGTFGINHGLELHKDVVEYANNKLAEFIAKSSALDEYDFCPPQFVVGNCLNLSSDCQLYDRVYCGAGCPTEHENFMKNLVKVGGILVMPASDQLLQITRIDTTNWETKRILPVSFASLVPYSNKNGEIPPTVTLPDRMPLTLQEICRSSIRSQFRYISELECPDLTRKRHRQLKKKKPRKRSVCQMVFPNFEGDVIDPDDEVELMEARRHVAQISAFIGEVVNRNNAMRRENGPSIDSGVISDRDRSELSSSDSADDIEYENSSTRKNNKKENSKKKESTSSSSAMEMEVETDDEEEEARPRDGRKRLVTRSRAFRPISSSSTMYIKTFTNGDTESDTDEFYKSPKSDKNADEEEELEEDEPKETYSSLMKKKIQLLPIPQTLKAFINYQRGFL